ncbi:DNA polymerase kappa isoform X3 [Ipomoea triloba]|uniref:DNA polymerase kappa isoform X3 n=1 Tax=Ipomoea triloba TaxID=35885 RepID=UPI00125E7678|nr:DNA polymerase kappa isoform X3 [Ipomoea triloba]
MAKSEVSATGDNASPSSSRPWQSYHTVYTNAKAGMEGVDKEKVQRIVYEMSKGSKYFENEERKEGYMKQKIENMRVQCLKLTKPDISHYQELAEKRILELEATRDLSRIWIHVDMDAFYAAVETLSNPSLQGKPMAVGTLSMLSTANYEARKFGVRAAMPGFIARKLCPELIFVPTDFKKYNHYSGLTRKIFQKYDPNFLATSLDEAYLDITRICKERGVTGAELKSSEKVFTMRLASHVVQEWLQIAYSLSFRCVFQIGGIGKVTENILKDVFGITTCEEMLQKSSFLCALFSRSSADFFLCVGLGLGGTDTPETKMRKSMSNERTFSATGDETLLYKKLEELAEMLSAEMEQEGLCGRTLTLKLKTASFEVRTRALTLPNYISSSEDILKHASKLLKAEFPVSLRLMGLRISQFMEENVGPSDPTQRTLSKFIVQGDASGKNADECLPLGSDVSDNAFTHDTHTDFPTNSGETISWDLRAPTDNQQISDPNDRCCIYSEELEKCPEPQNDELEINVCKSNEEGIPFSGQLEGISLDKPKSGAYDKTGSCSDHKDLVLWLDDYKCSLCGTELPPSFVEERQEHSDFHLAERLQDEESKDHHRWPTLKQRSVQNSDTQNRGRQRKKKKLCPTPTKCTPIDSFFVKTSQNF